MCECLSDNRPLRSTFRAIDARTLRLSLNGYFEACDLILKTMADQDVLA